MKRIAIALALAAGLAGVCPATAQEPRPFTVDDLLGHERIGQVRISPDARWIVVEHQAAYDQAASYRYWSRTSWLLSGLEIHRADGSAPVRRLASPGHDRGYVSGPFSPDGGRMAVFRLTESTWRLGVMTLATGEVDWWSITPEMDQFGRSLAWRSNDELVLVARADDDLPVQLRVGFAVQDRLPQLWRATASGHGVGAIHIPSGRRRDGRPQATPSRLMTVNLRTGRVRALASGEWFDIALSPDGRWLAALQNAEDLQSDPQGPTLVGTPIRRRRLAIVDLHTGRLIEPLPDEDFAMYLLSWSADSRRLLAFGRPVGAADFDGAGRYWAIAADRAPEPLDLGDARPWIERTWDGVPVPLAGWDGPRPLVQVRQTDGGRAWLRIERGKNAAFPVVEPGERIVTWAGRAALQRSGGLFALADSDRRIAAGRLIDQGQGADGGNPQAWNPDARELGRRILVEDACLARPAAPTARRCVGPVAPEERIVAASPAADFLVTTYQAPDGPSGVRLHREGATETLLSINEERAALAWGRIEAIPHPGPDGEPLTSWLLSPPGLAPGARPPVVVEVYPGRARRSAPASMTPGTTQLQNNEAVLAGAGYAVLIASLPHPGGGRPNSDDMAERILAIVAEADRRGLVDGERVALMGHSYGAYNVLRAATQSDRFKAVIASNGYADLTRSMELPPFFRISPEDGVPVGQLAGWGETGQGSIGYFPADPQAYVDASPYFAVDRIRTPTLLIETDLDNARFGSLFSALYRLDREAALVTYYGENHTLSSPGNVRDLHARILDWLARYLGPPDGGQAGLPVLHPDLEHGGDQGSVGAVAPD